METNKTISPKTGQPVLDTADDSWNEPFHTDDAKSSIGELTLIGGYVFTDKDGDKKLLNHVVMREITGNEEDILMNTRIPPGRKFRMVLARCLSKIGDGNGFHIEDKRRMAGIVDNLTFADYTQMLLHLRSISVDRGDLFTFSTNCPGCGNEFTETVDLGELPTFPMRDPLERVYDVDLPTGKRCRCQVMLGKHEDKISRAQDSGQDQFSTYILIRVLEIDGNPVKMKDIKNLTLKERNYLRSVFEKKEGGIETGVRGSCGACGRKFEIEIDISQKDFFFPSATVPG